MVPQNSRAARISCPGIADLANAKIGRKRGCANYGDDARLATAARCDLDGQNGSFDAIPSMGPVDTSNVDLY